MRTIIIFLFFASITGSVDAQTFILKGVINDSVGRPISAATIRVKHSGAGTMSDSAGAFSLLVKRHDSLVISAGGFLDTTLSAGDRNPMNIVLALRTKILHEAVVLATRQDSGVKSPDQARNQMIADAFQDYIRGAMYSNGAYVTTGYNPAARGAAAMTNVKTIGFGPLNTLNSGVMLPIVRHQEDTRGSRYLLKDFVRGVIVDKENHVMTDSFNLINYDKVDGQLLIAQGQGNYLAVDKEKVIAFAMKTADTSFIFMNVPVLSKINYFILVANGPKYSAYKSLRTSFSKANYQSNGLVESGHDYDEYVDKETYYWVKGTDSAGIFELKKKSIKAAFAGEMAKVDAFFSRHKYDDIDDSFIRQLIIYLNKP